MSKVKLLVPLNWVADKANFADVKDRYSIISASGKKLSDYVDYSGEMFYLWKRMDTDKVFGDFDLVVFGKALDYESAKMYLIKGEALEKAVLNNSKIDLSKEIPKYTGEEVVKFLLNSAYEKAF